MPFHALKKRLIPVTIVSVILGLTLTYFASTNVKQPDANTHPSSSDQTSINSPNVSTTESEALANAQSDVTKSKSSVTPEVTKTKVANVKASTSKAVASNASEIQKNLPPNKPAFNFTEGTHFVTKFPNEQAKNPVLVEFFSYMCPHCYNFEATMTLWKAQKPASVELIRVPVTFGRGQWRLAAKSYYIAEELNLVSKFSTAMFKKIHVEKKPPRKDSDLGKIFATLGVSNKDFTKAANSFNVDSKLRKADFLAKKYKVTGVPYFLINYKYETGRASYESQDSLFKLWNQLPGKDF